MKKPQIHDKTQILILTVALLVLLPNPAAANAGTPLMLYSAFHLFIANFFIGIIEAFILIRFYKTKVVVTSLTMITANYFSAFAVIGYFFFNGTYFGKSLPFNTVLWYTVDIYNMKYFTFLIPLALLLLTFFLELPFVAFTLRGKQLKFKRIVLIALLVQIPTNLLMLPGYIYHSDISLLTHVNPCRDCIHVSDEYEIYYENPIDGGIYVFDFKDMSSKIIVSCDGSEKQSKRIRLHETENDDGSRTLSVIRGYQHGTHEIKTIKVIEAELPTDAENYSTKYFEETKYWAWGSHYPRYGVDIGEVPNFDKCLIHVGLEAPYFMYWLDPRDTTTILQNRYVVFQLGHQVLVLDIENRTIQKLFMGNNPHVARKKNTLSK